MNYFLDTSSLVKIYHREVGTPEVLALYQNSECNLIISELCRIEFTSTVYRKHRENRLNFKAFKALLNKFQEDLDSRYEVLRFSSLVTVEAETLLHRYAEKHSLEIARQPPVCLFQGLWRGNGPVCLFGLQTQRSGQTRGFSGDDPVNARGRAAAFGSTQGRRRGNPAQGTDARRREMGLDGRVCAGSTTQDTRNRASLKHTPLCSTTTGGVSAQGRAPQVRPSCVPESRTT